MGFGARVLGFIVNILISLIMIIMFLFWAVSASLGAGGRVGVEGRGFGTWF